MYRLESQAQPGQHISELDTPVLVVQLDRMERNIERWQRLADESGILFRPHIKTHKVPAIAEMQRQAGAHGIATAKVAEAEIFANAGFDDIVVAYPVFGESKWNRLAELAGDARIAVNADSVEGIEGVEAAAMAAGVSVGIWIDVDTGMHRGGVDRNDFDELRRLCDAAGSHEGTTLEGITTHRQVFFADIGEMSPDDAGRDETQILVDLRDRLRASGIPLDGIAAGGSIAGRGAAGAPGITELRAGTYVFCDLMQVGFGVADWDDLALTALCTVVSTRQPGGATVDGGSKTFSGDRGLIGATVPGLEGIAKAVDRDIYLERLTEEHGMAVVGDDEVKLGEKTHFYPMHACTAVNLADQLVGVRDDVIEVVWPVLARGKRT